MSSIMVSIFDYRSFFFSSCRSFIFLFFVIEFSTSAVKGEDIVKDIIKSSQLSGKHIIVSGYDSVLNFRVVRNATGHILQLKALGGEVLSWLATYYNFTYSPLQINVTDFDSKGEQPGLVKYLLSGECDVVASAVVPNKNRIALFDFTHPSINSPVCFLIPKPDPTVNVLSVAQSFSLWVWVAILGSMMAVLVFLYLFIHWLLKMREINEANLSIHHGSKISVSFKLLLHVFGILVKQVAVNSFVVRYWPILFVVGTWSLASFILTNYYTVFLISHVAAPNPQPLITSIYELRDRPDIRLVTDKNRNADSILTSANSGFFKELGDKLREYPQSRCPTSRECAELMKKGLHVYISSKDSYVLKLMREDFQATGHCNFELGKQCFDMYTAWVLPKKSPFLGSINKGFMRMSEAGLMLHWQKQNKPDVHQCLNKKKRHSRIIDDSVTVSLRGLSGAFVVLLVGYALSIFVFICERVRFMYLHHRAVLAAR